VQNISEEACNIYELHLKVDILQLPNMHFDSHEITGYEENLSYENQQLVKDFSKSFVISINRLILGLLWNQKKWSDRDIIYYSKVL
jgi:predicted chitinase